MRQGTVEHEQRAAEVTAYVSRYHDEWGYSPTLRDIQARFDMGSTSVAAHWVKAAVALGYIAKPVERRTRSLRVTGEGQAAIAGMEPSL